MMRTFGRMTALALALSSYTFVTGCNGRPGASSIQGDSTGSVQVALQLADGRTIQSASYTITGPNGFTRTGSINVASSNTLSATIGTIPAGAGYQISITATTTDGATSCLGSASFNVIAGQIVAVTVSLACHEAPRTGSAMVSGRLNLCPTIDGIGANPAEVNVG